MDAIQLGPLVISAPRFHAALGLLTLVIFAEFSARRARARAAVTNPATQDAAWAWNAAFAVIVGARLGFVIEHFAYYVQNPLGVLAIWQGGFSPWWGVAAGVALAVWSYRRRLAGLRTAIMPAVAGLFVWLAVPTLLAPVDGEPVALPAVALERLEGGSMNLSELAGKPVAVNLWATWCIPCRRELPELARAASENPDVQFVYVNQGESRQAIQRYLESDLDAELSNVMLDVRQSVGAAMRSVGLPTTYFFNAAGEHIKTQVGEISGPALDLEIARLR